MLLMRPFLPTSLADVQLLSVNVSTCKHLVRGSSCHCCLLSFYLQQHFSTFASSSLVSLFVQRQWQLLTLFHSLVISMTMMAVQRAKCPETNTKIRFCFPFSLFVCCLFYFNVRDDLCDLAFYFPFLPSRPKVAYL